MKIDDKVIKNKLFESKWTITIESDMGIYFFQGMSRIALYLTNISNYLIKFVVVLKI